MYKAIQMHQLYPFTHFCLLIETLSGDSSPVNKLYGPFDMTLLL